MKKLVFTVLTVILCNMCAIEILAQDESTTKQGVYTEDMHLRADKDVGYGEESSFMVWHGYLNFEFDKVFNEKSNSNFDNHEFYLSARSDLHEKLSITAEFEYEHNPEVLVLPIQAYADLKLSDMLIIRSGLFFTPMGLPRSYNLRGNQNRMIRQVSLTHDIMFENWSEVGLEFMGQFDFGLFYDIAIGNGMPGTFATGDSWFNSKTTLSDHSEDNNENKALHSRIGYHSRDFAGGELCIAGSFGNQKYDDAEEMTMMHTGADIRYLHSSGFRIQAEFMSRSGDELADSAGEANNTNAVAMDASGWYLQVSKRWVPQGNKFINFIEPAFQVDMIDLNIHNDANTDRMTYALALMYSPMRDYLIKFEYDIVQEMSGDAVDNDMIWAAIVVEF